MTERWRRDLRALEEIEPSDAFWSKVDGPHPRRRNVEPGTLRPGRIVVAVVVGIVVLAGIVVPLKLLAPLGDRDKPLPPGGGPTLTPSFDPSGIPDVARIDCHNGRPVVLTPQVRVQPDGFRIVVQGDRIGDEVILSEDLGKMDSYGFHPTENDVPKPSLLIEPGNYQVVCINGEEVLPDTTTLDLIRIALPTARSISVVDPGGYYMPGAPDCPDGRMGGDIGADAVQNPVGPELVRRSVEGALPTDTIEPSGYPDQGENATRWHVVREGRIIADVVVITADPDRVRMYVDQCAIPGAENLNDLRAYNVPEAELQAGNSLMPLATTYTVPGYAHCNPYGDAACSPVWLSVDSWARLNDKDPFDEIGLAYPGRMVWCKPSDVGDVRCVVHPSDIPRVVFMPQGDAQRWFDDHGCGESLDLMCRGLPPPGLPVTAATP